MAEQFTLQEAPMTQDEIIEMADKADAEADNVLNMKGEYHPNWHQVRDEIFAKLVAEKERERISVIAMDAAEKAVDVAIKLEREACAKLLETTDLSGLKDNPAMQSWVAEMLLAYVKAIRARGQA